MDVVYKRQPLWTQHFVCVLNSNELASNLTYTVQYLMAVTNKAHLFSLVYFIVLSFVK